MKVLRLGGVHQTKKDPRGAHTPGIPSSLSDAPSPSCRCSSVRSRRTVRRGGEHRTWFGCPQAIKKAAGNAATKGRMRRTCWRPSTTTLFKPSVVPWTTFTNCQKKERSLPAPLFDACPLTEGNRARVMGRTPTGRRHYDQTTPEVSKPREGRVPCPSRSTHRPHSPKGAHLCVHSATNPSAISRNTHQ